MKIRTSFEEKLRRGMLPLHGNGQGGGDHLDKDNCEVHNDPQDGQVDETLF